MSLIIFTHANSFGASTYRVLFRSLRARGFTVKAIEKIGHDPAYPVSNNWPHLVRQLAAFAGPGIESVGEGAWLVGHSLGGYLSTLLAARHPVLGSHTIKGVVLLDSPLVGGWKARALQFAKSTPLIEQVSPSRASRTRRTHWPSREDALASFASKKAFARWQPQVLKDYIQHGLVEDKGKFRLAFDRAVETAIYDPKWWYTAPVVTPAAWAMSRLVAAAKPPAAKARRATSTMRLRVSAASLSGGRPIRARLAT